MIDSNVGKYHTKIINFSHSIDVDSKKPYTLEMASRHLDSIMNYTKMPDAKYLPAANGDAQEEPT